MNTILLSPLSFYKLITTFKFKSTQISLMVLNEIKNIARTQRAVERMEKHDCHILLVRIMMILAAINSTPQ